jgi:hypothetical protein
MRRGVAERVMLEQRKANCTTQKPPSRCQACAFLHCSTATTKKPGILADTGLS